MRDLAVALVTCLAVLAVAGSAGAEHEIYYRYTLVGYVKDARGRPLSGREVRVVREKTAFAYLAETDAKGLYVLVLRLGDETLGERLTLKTGTATTRVTVRFEPANRTDERGTRIDIENGRFVERAAWFPSTLALFLGAPKR